jgi:hypothetical protein
MAGCAATSPEPVRLQSLSERSARTPVVLIPGITGSSLRDRETGRLVWGTGHALVSPRDGGYALAAPVSLEPDQNRRILPAGPILRIRFLLWRRQVYSSVVDLMEHNGYRPGDLRDPRAGETFFIFDYDWRLESLRAVEELGRRLEELRQVRGDEVLRVYLICQSNAARICRYFAKYGVATPNEAETQTSRRPQNIRVDKLLLVGTSNGGAIRVLHEMNRGRKYVFLIGRRWRPETLFTFPSLYEDLPYHRSDLFFDTEGKLLEVDLFDPRTWQQFEWSVYAPEVARRLRRTRRTDLFADPERRAGFLSQALTGARRLHDLLARDAPGFGATRYYLLQNSALETPARALLTEENGSWKTLFAGDRRVRRDPHLLSLAAAPGDGHATVESQNWLSPQERAALAHAPVYLPGRHWEVIFQPDTHRRLLDFLAD